MLLKINALRLLYTASPPLTVVRYCSGLCKHFIHSFWSICFHLKWHVTHRLYTYRRYHSIYLYSFCCHRDGDCFVGSVLLYAYTVSFYKVCCLLGFSPSQSVAAFCNISCPPIVLYGLISFSHKAPLLISGSHFS